MLHRILLAILVIYSSLVSGQIRFFHFVDSVYQTRQISKSVLLRTELINAGFKLSDSESVNNKVFKIMYMHLLMTSNYAVNGDNYGGFQIPFFWNYTNPNPRDEIRNNKKGKRLRDMPAPKGSGYLSMASLDRTPVIFWSDFITSEPLYSWDYLTGFYTFGWCSEREMAFKAWLGLEGISSSICFKDNHVWNEIELKSMPGYFLFIDNSFNRFEIRPMSQRTKPDPKDKFLKWYNQNGEDKNIQRTMAAMLISKKRAAVLRKQIEDFFYANVDDY